MFYNEVFLALNKNKVNYAVAGGVAVVLYGFPRLTLDLDLIVELKEANLSKFFDSLYNLGYRPKVPVTKEQFMDKKNHQKWIKEKGMVVFSFFHLRDHLKVIDMFVTEPIKFPEVKKKLKKIKINNLIIPTIGIEHLKKLKIEASRPKDLLDIKNLEEIEKLTHEKD